MKNIRIFIAAVIAATSITASAANPSNWTPPSYSDKRVSSKAEAEDCCKAEAKVALVCKDCKTSTEKAGTDKKGIMSWFDAEATHDCSGCKGNVTFKPSAGGKAPATAAHTHECSKCGKGSAYTCSTHAKDAK